MNKMRFVFATLLVLSAGPAFAQGGINLGWVDCPSGAGYQLTRTFACAVNSGAGTTHTLIASYVAPANVLAVSANELVIDLQTSGVALAPWWSVRSTAPAGCRNASLTGSPDFTVTPLTCYDYWQGGASSGVSSDPPVGNRARLKGLAGLAAGSPLITSVSEGTEVYSLKFNINSAKTVGLGSCAGCTEEACIVLNSIRLNQPVGPPAEGVSIFIGNPAVSAHVMWQGWSAGTPNLCPDITPAKQQTWGSIKALYR